MTLTVGVGGADGVTGEGGIGLLGGLSLCSAPIGKGLIPVALAASLSLGVTVTYGDPGAGGECGIGEGPLDTDTLPVSRLGSLGCFEICKGAVGPGCGETGEAGPKEGDADRLRGSDIEGGFNACVELSVVIEALWPRDGAMLLAVVELIVDTLGAVVWLTILSPLEDGGGENWYPLLREFELIEDVVVCVSAEERELRSCSAVAL
jgi:hypothetical protein